MVVYNQCLAAPVKEQHDICVMTVIAEAKCVPLADLVFAPNPIIFIIC